MNNVQKQNMRDLVISMLSDELGINEETYQLLLNVIDDYNLNDLIFHIESEFISNEIRYFIAEDELVNVKQYLNLTDSRLEFSQEDY